MENPTYNLQLLEVKLSDSNMVLWYLNASDQFLKFIFVNEIIRIVIIHLGWDCKLFTFIGIL